MVSLNVNTRKYCRSKADVVEFVSGLLPYLELDLRLTMTIKAVRSGDYSVYIATDGSLDDTVTQSYSDVPLSI